MRLGACEVGGYSDPVEWAALHLSAGYRAAIWPAMDPEADEETVQSYVKAAQEADILIAEVGVWSNPLYPDEAKRKEALEKCKATLALADRVGARCCVNISGSRGDQWDGPHPDNLTGDTFDMVVESVRGIIDAVKPSRTFYALEPMPWMYPDSTDSYERLIQAVDRKQFAVHMDPVNMICSPQLYFGNGELIREFFTKLGPYIKSCHSKDIRLSGELNVHLDVVPTGQGGLDYPAYLREIGKLDPDMPLILEHMTKDEFPGAAEYIRSVARDVGAHIL